jgi:malate synthase
MPAITKPATPVRDAELELLGPAAANQMGMLDSRAQRFLTDLVSRFSDRVEGLLATRIRRQREFDLGNLPDFRADTRHIRESKWQIGSIPGDLLDRRVEITGPVERKMIINALNSGARAFMADFEDSLAPTWGNVIEGQRNLHDAVRREIDYTSSEGKTYRLNDKTAVLIVRPRGWHLPEKHVRLAGRAIPAALFDFGLYLFHNAHESLKRGSGPYFYLPKLESYEEALLWHDVIIHTEHALQLKPGTVKVTVLIETLPAAFEMDEILFALREHIVGLNCGRWDYIFSFIKKLHAHREYVLPERNQVGMTTHFLRSYSQLLIQTCHRRGAFAMGGMAAQIPIKGDTQANAVAIAKVQADKEREAGDGHDGTWVAHPGLVPIALEIFNRQLQGPNQLTRLRDDVKVAASDLLRVPEGTITETGVRNNISVSIQYLASWLAGNGCVPINHLMEDAATAEIARAQLWQWTHQRDIRLDDGRTLTGELVESLREAETKKLLTDCVEDNVREHVRSASALLQALTTTETFADFLTLDAYQQL